MGKLFLVPTPIGNAGDITLRALEILRTVDEVICEERKVGSRFLKHHGIQQNLRTLNEHNESEQIRDLLDLLKDGKQLALISDAGTPVFADPGYRLIQAIIASQGEIVSLPGPSSLMTALVVSGLTLSGLLLCWISSSEARVPSKGFTKPETLADHIGNL